MRFYRIEQPRPGSPQDHWRTDAVKEEGFNVGDCIRCPKCNRPLSMLKWLPPFRIELESWSSQYADVADVGDDLIVSDRFRRVFASNGLKGLQDFVPVEIVTIVQRRGKPIAPVPEYYKASVVRSATTINQEASGFVWKDKAKVCAECLFDTLKRYRHLIVTEESWSGDDIFFPRGGKGPLVSEHFKATFEESGLKGVVFVPADSPEAGFDSCPWEATGASGQSHQNDVNM